MTDPDVTYSHYHIHNCVAAKDPSNDLKHEYKIIHHLTECEQE